VAFLRRIHIGCRSEFSAHTQSAKQRLTLGNDTAPMITEYVLTVNDE
jgi:hypothetical protein